MLAKDGIIHMFGAEASADEFTQLFNTEAGRLLR